MKLDLLSTRSIVSTASSGAVDHGPPVPASSDSFVPPVFQQLLRRQGTAAQNRRRRTGMPALPPLDTSSAMRSDPASVASKETQGPAPMRRADTSLDTSATGSPSTVGDSIWSPTPSADSATTVSSSGSARPGSAGSPGTPLDAPGLGFVRGGKHAAPVQIDWHLLTARLGPASVPNVRDELSKLDTTERRAQARAALPPEVNAIEARANNSSGTLKALGLAREVESAVSKDLSESRLHVSKQLQRCASGLKAPTSSAFKRLFENNRAVLDKNGSLFNAVFDQAASHFRDRVERSDGAPSEIFRTRQKSLDASVIAGFKTEAAALDDPGHALWTLRALIAPGLSRENIASALGR